MKRRRILPLIFLIWMCSNAIGEAAGNPAAARHLWGDFDNDGLKDLFVINRAGNKLFRNLGNGDFEDVTVLAFPTGPKRGITGVWGDYNHDGWPDLFLFHEKGFTLFRNDTGGEFVDVTEDAGLDPKLSGSKVLLEDYDQDGFHDLLVQAPTGDRIYHNKRGEYFEEITLPGINGDKGIQEVTADGVEGIFKRADFTGGFSEPRSTDEKTPESKPRFPKAPTAPQQPVINGHKRDRMAPPLSSKNPNPFQKALPSFLPLKDGDWDYWSNPPHMFPIPTGNIGIGTANPANKLHIVGSESAPLVSIDQMGTHRGLRVYTQNACALWVENAGNHGLRITHANGDGIRITNANGNGVYVEQAGGWAGYFNGDGYFDGNLGIQMASPQRALHVKDVLRLEPRSSAPDSPSEGDLYVNSTDHHIYCYLDGSWKQLD